MTAEPYSLSSRENVAKEEAVPSHIARSKHSRLFNVRPSFHDQPLHVHRIKKDGNCLFRALAYRLHRDEEAHASVRERIVKNVIDNWTRYGDFTTGDAYDVAISSVDDYEKYMGTEGVHGGHLELEAAADVFKMRIKLVHCDGANFNRQFGKRQERKRLTLLYSGDGDNGHYDVCVEFAGDTGRNIEHVADSSKLKGQCEMEEPLKPAVLAQLPKEEVICERSDVAPPITSAQQDVTSTIRYHTEYLPSTPSLSLSSKELCIEVGADVVLVRHICKRDVLSDGTRLIIRDLTDRIPTCVIWTGDKNGTIVPLCRIYLAANDKISLKCLFKRKKIPDTLDVGNSINKSRGRLYIAVSCGRFISGIRAHFAGSNSNDRNQVTSVGMRYFHYTHDDNIQLNI